MRNPGVRTTPREPETDVARSPHAAGKEERAVPAGDRPPVVEPSHGAGRARIDDVPRQLVYVGVVIALVATVGQTISHLVNALALDSRYDSLNAGQAGEGNIFTWASAAAAFGVAVGAVLLAFVTRRLRWAVLAAIATFLSLDDVVQVHENAGSELGDALGLPDFFVNALWPALYVPLLVVAFALLYRVGRESVPVAGRAVNAGLALLGVAVVAEALTTGIRASGSEAGDWPFELEVAFEEACELAGWILIASGVLATVVVKITRSARGDEQTARGGSMPGVVPPPGRPGLWPNGD